jgi:tRNA (cytidine/uridine-2'-O-)-methyltransferase
MEVVMNLNVVLHRPEIPGNTGAIGRLCVCLDLRLHLIRPLGFDIDEKAVRRAGMDYWQYVDLVLHDDWPSFLAAEAPEQLVFASTRGKRSYLDHQFVEGEYLVFGRESDGLPEEIHAAYGDRMVNVPMPGEHHRSLNLANAASIIVYEAYRQLVHAPNAAG